ncbi:hypothetical protein ScPMuIL_003183 [Solemya velum]
MTSSSESKWFPSIDFIVVGNRLNLDKCQISCRFFKMADNNEYLENPEDVLSAHECIIEINSIQKTCLSRFQEGHNCVGDALKGLNSGLTPEFP